MSQTIIYDGVNFRDAHKFVLTPVSHPYAPEQRVPFMETAWKDGGLANDRFSGARNISISGFIDSTGLADAQSKLDSLIADLNIRSEAALVLTPYGDNRFWNAILASGVNAQWNNKTATLSWTMLAPDPRAFASAPTNENYLTSAAHPTADTHVTSVILGTANADPVITMNPTGPNRTTDLLVENETTSAKIGVTDPGNFSDAAFRVRINTPAKLIEVSTDSGANWDVINSFINSFNGFPELKFGVTNSIKITGLNASSVVDIDYSVRFM